MALSERNWIKETHAMRLYARKERGLLFLRLPEHSIRFDIQLPNV